MIGHSNNGLGNIEGLDDVLVTQDDLVTLRKHIFRIDTNLSHRYKVAYGKARSDAERAMKELEEAQAFERRGRRWLASYVQFTLDRDRIKKNYPPNTAVHSTTG